jgi:hypothetical protein
MSPTPNPYALSPTDLANLIAQLQQDNQKLTADVAALQQAASCGSSQPGLPQCSKQQAFWYSVEIPLAQGANSRTPGTFTTSQDGPFVALAVSAAWRETQGAFAGRWIPPSSEQVYIQAIASYNFTSAPRPDVTDFEWEVSDGNSDRNWQDKPIPSSCLSSNAGQPTLLPAPGVFSTNSTITVAVTPIRPVTAAGILKFTFWGYKALGTPQMYPGNQ